MRDDKNRGDVCFSAQTWICRGAGLGGGEERLITNAGVHSICRYSASDGFAFFFGEPNSLHFSRVTKHDILATGLPEWARHKRSRSRYDVVVLIAHGKGI